jgi:hypothetical protein
VGKQLCYDATVRIAWICALGLVVGGLGAGCKDKGGGNKTVAADMSDRVAKLQAEEGDVLGRRENVARERKKLNEDRAALAEKRKQVLATGGDVKQLDQEEAALVERESQLDAAEQQLSQKIDTLLSQYQELSAGAAAGGEDITRREAGVATREKDFARREAALAEREKALAEREKAQGLREKETCGGGTTTIVQAAPLPKGTKYSKRDVESILKQSRRKMSDKGILSSDLPSHASVLEKEANEAMADGDFGKAKLAADTLYATVDSMKIDKGFIASKMGRLNALMKGKQLSKETDELFRGATGDYGDGKFSAANGKLNKIYAALR